MATERTPVTAGSALFTFYDIESLSNVFSVCAYTPRRGEGLDELEVFFLVDDDRLASGIEARALDAAIKGSNPGLPAVRIAHHDLRTPRANLRLARLIGLSDAEQVNDPGQASSYPADLRPVCDTDPGFDQARHPYLAGYNSLNYDTTMFALYLSEVFADVVDHRIRVGLARGQLAQARTPQDRADAEQLLRATEAVRPSFQPVRAAALRAHNDALFSDKHSSYMPGYLGWQSPAGRIRRAMLHSGRHLDVARLNELQVKVSLKRLLGMLGHQIKESEKLSHDTVIATPDELYELLAYNVSDCLGLARLFAHPTYSSAFDLKAGLLAQYSETVFNRNGTVRRDRLTIDSSSAKFVARILAPYAALDDIDAVSFRYPAKEVAAERGIAQVNVLEECRTFFYEQIADPAARARFDRVYDYYRSIEGQNFNDSARYAQLHGRAAQTLGEIPKEPNNLPYFFADGSPSSCFVTFSTGGIHGAEADMTVFAREQGAYIDHLDMLVTARGVFPHAGDFVAEAKRQHNLLALPDGTGVDKRLVLLGSDPEKVKYRKPKKDDPEQAEQLARAQAHVPDPADLLATRRPNSQALDVVLDDGRVLDGKAVLARTAPTSAAYRDEPAKKYPVLFPAQDPEGRRGEVDLSTKLHPKYAHTSVGHVIHEDFTSYYPNLLRNMRAFYNPELGEDRYARIFFDKERYGQELQRPGISEDEQARLATLRAGTKLILNAASGAGDAAHETPIRMNNRIISMRIIGQLFSWRIGQAQTLAGARIISTNTDGLYSLVDGASGFDAETNNRVLAEQQEAIGVEIKPEPMFLISKDSNNRLELLDPKSGPVAVPDKKIHAASGGTLACHAGPTPTKSLAHPAVIDLALARYLQTVASRGEAALSEPFDTSLGRKILGDALDVEDPVTTALLFQNVIAASRGSITYPFAADPINAPTSTVGTSTGSTSTGSTREPTTQDTIPITGARPLQMVNRVLIVRPGTPGAVSLHNAGAWKVPAASRARRRKDPDLATVERDATAVKILMSHGWAADRQAARQQGLTLLPEDQDVVTRRINGIDPTWSLIVCNDDLRALDPDRLVRLLDFVDLEVYTHILAETFTKNWKNA
ncbi:hypothetical protein ACFOY4_01520 [Actinomadura syzygii]|uniref:Uncharacterized protein n=1 Tax=Actinomadura syzygii TaxID=1427538 RepID=A0A5D0TS31_9ACTN|nr:hypothetical protein [Actinomadura syzygii]TYC08574.1 hypothetical protein FXF65_37405 [Actinomadura syzygii]